MKNSDKKNSLNMDDKTIILPKSGRNSVALQKAHIIINNIYNFIVSDPISKKTRAKIVSEYVGIKDEYLSEMINRIVEERLKARLHDFEVKIYKEYENEKIKSEQELEEQVRIMMNMATEQIMRDILGNKFAEFNIYVDNLRKAQENNEKRQSEMQNDLDRQQEELEKQKKEKVRIEEELRQLREEEIRRREELKNEQENQKIANNDEIQKLREEFERRLSDYDEKSKHSKHEEQKAVQNIAEVKPVKPSTSKKVYNKNGGKLHPLTLKYLKKKTLKVNIPLLILGILFTIVGGVLLFQYGKPGFAMMWNAGLDLFAISLFAMLIERFTRGYYNKYKTLIRVTIFFAVYILCLIWCGAFLLLALHEMLIIELPRGLIIAFCVLLGFGSLGFMFCDYQFCRHTSIKRWLTDFI